MKIKIGNFNFINNMENKLRSFEDFKYKENYFWIDGKEDTLFVTNTIQFEREEYGKLPEYEKELKNKYRIIYVYKEFENQVNQYIDNKVNDIFKYRNYSKYELYKELDLYRFKNLNEDKDFKITYEDELVLDIDRNKINVGKLEINPYTERIDNLDELLNQGYFKTYINKKLILKEIEKRIAPPYIFELDKIQNFLQEKQNVNLVFKGCEKFKCEARIGCILRTIDSKIELNLNYVAEENFKKENPTKDVRSLKLEDFKGILYGKNMLEVDGRILENINKQIAITLEDRLKQKIDFLKKDLEEEYRDFINKIDTRNNDYLPYNLEDTIKIIENSKKANEKKTWHTKELDKIIYKRDLINFLEQAKTIEDIKEVCIELGDNELQSIYYGLLYEEENCDCKEDEEESEV